MGVDADRAIPGRPPTGSLALDLDVGLGHLEVTEMAPSPASGSPNELDSGQDARATRSVPKAVRMAR